MHDSHNFGRHQTRERALSVLLAQIRKLRPGIDDQAARDVLTDELAADILNVAWKHQFDDSRKGCVMKIRNIVEIAIEDNAIGLTNVAE